MTCIISWYLRADSFVALSLASVNDLLRLKRPHLPTSDLVQQRHKILN